MTQFYKKSGKPLPVLLLKDALLQGQKAQFDCGQDLDQNKHSMNSSRNALTNVPVTMTKIKFVRNARE